MPSELLSLAEASRLLGISVERVRQLVVAGDIPGVRIGNAWAVPLHAVSARGHSTSRRGRPLSAARVWEVIASGDVDLSNRSRYRNRADIQRFAIGRADLDWVIEQSESVQSGVKAAIAYGEPLSDDVRTSDVYVSRVLMDILPRSVALAPDPLGDVALRVVPQPVWEVVAQQSFDEGHGFAPRSAVALDLMESGDPRHWAAAERLVGADG